MTQKQPSKQNLYKSTVITLDRNKTISTVQPIPLEKKETKTRNGKRRVDVDIASEEKLQTQQR